MIVGIEYRLWVPGDDIVALTELLHWAYRELDDAGLKFMATWQPPEVTLERMERGETHLAVLDRAYVGTVTLYLPDSASGCEWYEKPGVAYFGQFGVDPDFRALGVGRNLLQRIEMRARESGAEELALDTSELATRLVDTYTRHGYRFIQHVQWDGVNYRSVVLSKRL